MLGLILLLFAQFTVPSHTGALAASSGGGITFVQGEAVKAVASFTVTTPSFTCGAGHYLYIFTASGVTGDTFAISTTTGNTVTSTVLNHPVGDMPSEVFGVSSCNGTVGTYTNTCTVSASCILTVLEFAGATAVDSTNTCAGGSYSATCSVTTLAANTYVIGSIMTNVCGPQVPLTGWVDLGNSLSPPIFSAAGIYGQAETSAGLKTMTPNNGAGCGYTTDTEIMVALK